MLSVRVLVLLVLISCVCGGKIEKRVQTQKDVGIIGGHQISIDKAPYIVSLRLEGSHWCGGSIIHERFILSAAHCIDPDTEYQVLVGTDKSDKGGTLYDVEKIIVHEEYTTVTRGFDICILKLNESLTFGPTVKKIALTAKDVKLIRGMMLNATGWGVTEEHNDVSSTLQQVTVPMVLRLNCHRYYETPITHRMLCAGGPGRDACYGDSGGPLTWNNIQVGITSFGIGCGQDPGVYTRVSTMQNWINDIIASNL